MAIDDQSSTPLHKASEQGWVDIVSVLLQANVDVNALDADGDTPLHLAAHGATAIKNRQHVAVVELLLKNGADPAIERKSGKRPDQLTKSKEVRELIEKAALEMGKVPRKLSEELGLGLGPDGLPTSDTWEVWESRRSRRRTAPTVEVPGSSGNGSQNTPRSSQNEVESAPAQTAAPAPSSPLVGPTVDAVKPVKRLKRKRSGNGSGDDAGGESIPKSSPQTHQGAKKVRVVSPMAVEVFDSAWLKSGNLLGQVQDDALYHGDGGGVVSDRVLCGFHVRAELSLRPAVQVWELASSTSVGERICEECAGAVGPRGLLLSAMRRRIAAMPPLI